MKSGFKMRSSNTSSFKMMGSSLKKKEEESVDLTRKDGPRAKKIKSNFEKMSYAEQEKYMNEKHHSIAPTISDFISDAQNKKKSKK